MLTTARRARARRPPARRHTSLAPASPTARLRRGPDPHDLARCWGRFRLQGDYPPPEDVCLCWLAMRCGHPVRWLEDWREHLTANANRREHYYCITGYAERDGQLLGIDREASVDSGAYSAYPFSACLEAAQVASILPGPTISRPIAAGPGRSRRTSARSCPIAASPGPASASPGIGARRRRPRGWDRA